MGCCGGGSRSIRKQVVPKAAPTKKVAVQRIARNPQRQKVEINRQYVIPRQTCPKCGYPTMLVNIANRERNQCSNANCRYIL